jgi:short-subunit dehydrogenase
MSTIITPSQPLVSRKCAIVIGASSGIGAALVRTLVQHGYYVAAVARREALLADLCESINTTSENGASAIYFKHDVTNFNEIPQLFQQITGDLHGLDLIIYAAGIQLPSPPGEYLFEKDESMVMVNLLGAMAWLGQAALRFERAGSGHIVGISSIAGDRGRRLNPGYNTTKAALSTYLEALRNRLSQHGVKVTTIKPGFVNTSLLENAPKTMWVVSPNEAAKSIYKAIRNGSQTRYVPSRWRYVSLIIRHAPSFIFRRMNI